MKRTAITAAAVAVLSVTMMAGPAQAQTKEGNVGCGQTQRCEVTTYAYPGATWTQHEWTAGTTSVGGGYWTSYGNHTSTSGMASIAHYEVSSDYLISVKKTDCIPKPV